MTPISLLVVFILSIGAQDAVTEEEIQNINISAEPMHLDTKTFDELVVD